jgi:hypothetical protein
MLTIIKENYYISTVLDIPDNLIIPDLIEDYRVKVLNTVKYELPPFNAKEEMLKIIEEAYNPNFIGDIQEDIKDYILNNTDSITFNDFINIFHILDLTSSTSLIFFMQKNGARRVSYSIYNLIDDNYFLDDTFDIIDTIFKEFDNYLLINNISKNITDDISNKLNNMEFEDILNTYKNI